MLLNNSKSLNFSSLVFLGFKNPLFNKTHCHFLLRQTIFINPMSFLKCFKINMNLIFIIPINGIYEINSCKNKTGFGGGPTYMISWLIDRLIDSFVMYDWFNLFLDMRIIIYIYCSLILLHDSAFVTGGPGTHSFSFWSFYMHISILMLCMTNLSIYWFSLWLPRQLHPISKDPTLGT